MAFDQALALCHGISYPYGEGRFLYEQGCMWMASGEPGPAHTAFESALNIFRRLGARPYITLTEEALSKR